MSRDRSPDWYEIGKNPATTLEQFLASLGDAVQADPSGALCHFSVCQRWPDIRVLMDDARYPQYASAARDEWESRTGRLRQEHLKAQRDAERDSKLPPTVVIELHILNRILRRTWLQSGVDVYFFEPKREADGHPLGLTSREECDDVMSRPVRRFLFMADVFTSLDGHITEDNTGFTVIFNRHFDNHYPEDRAFSNEDFLQGTVVTWDRMKRAAVEYVKLSNARVGQIRSQQHG